MWGRLFNKLAVVTIIFILSSLSACTNYANYEVGTKGTEYADTEFNNEESQLYVRKNVAATETGYYYISQSPVHTGSYVKNYMYFFDIGSGKSTVLCSKLECEHNDENCEAYLSGKQCVGSNIWYYNQRIYMIERTQEKDMLVSYDKNLRDKKNHMELSVDGNSVNATSQVSERTVINGDRLFYIVEESDAHCVYSVSLKEESKPQLIKRYKFEHEVAELLTLYPVPGKIYMKMICVDENKKSYLCDVYDIASNQVSNIYNSENDDINIRGEMPDVHTWNQGVYIIDNNLFFATIEENKFIVNKLDVTTKKCEEIYVINAEEHNNTASYIDIKGSDGQYIYILEGLDPKRARKETVNGNNLHIIDITGKHIDTMKLENYSEGDIRFDSFCIDKRYIFVTSTYNIKGLELNEKQQQKYDELYKNAVITHESVGISVMGVIDKKQIGTGEYSWINGTVE